MMQTVIQQAKQSISNHGGAHGDDSGEVPPEAVCEMCGSSLRGCAVKCEMCGYVAPANSAKAATSTTGACLSASVPLEMMMIPRAVAENARQMTIPARLKGSLIGRGGENITRIRMDSQAEVRVSDDDGSETCTVYVKGTSEHMDCAIILIQTLLSASTKPHWGGGEWQAKFLDVPTECIAGIIGQGGHNLSLLSERTGCKVKFMMATDLDPNQPADKQVCMIKGPPDKLVAAELTIHQRIAEVTRNFSRKRHRSGDEEDERSFQPVVTAASGVCVHHMRKPGSCKNGARCRYAHASRDTAQAEELAQDAKLFRDAQMMIGQGSCGVSGFVPCSVDDPSMAAALASWAGYAWGGSQDTNCDASSWEAQAFHAAHAMQAVQAAQAAQAAHAAQAVEISPAQTTEAAHEAANQAAEAPHTAAAPQADRAVAPAEGQHVTQAASANGNEGQHDEETARAIRVLAEALWLSSRGIGKVQANQGSGHSSVRPAPKASAASGSNLMKPAKASGVLVRPSIAVAGQIAGGSSLVPAAFRTSAFRGTR